MRGSRFWGAVALAGLAGAVSTAGCSCGDSNTNPSGSGAGGAGGSSSTNNGGGGAGSGDGKIKTASLVAEQSAFDAALSDDGSLLYFTGTTNKGGAVFSVPASGGNPAVLTEGDPLVAPLGIAVSPDGKTLFIADPGAEDTKEDGGEIFSVLAEGGKPKVLSGTSGAVARSLDAVDEKGKPFIYFSGSLKGAVGVYKVSASGGGVTTVGKDLRDPAGLAVTADGTVFVVDTIAGSRSDADIIQITSSGKVSTFLQHLDVGYPAGLALAQDEKALLVSGLRDTYGHAAVLRVDTTSREITYFPLDTDKKSDFVELFEPGGLHRGKGTDRYAWVVGDASGGGVFLLK